MTVEEAHAYVGTDNASGASQLALLLIEGLKRSHHVVEIGCGALHLARPLVTYLNPGRYTGIDPNTWIRTTVLDADPDLQTLMDTNDVRFLSRDDFTTGEAACADFTFSHSILSHAAGWQLGQYLDATALMLRPRGKAVASLRLGDDSNADRWINGPPQYVTYFSQATVEAEAAARGLKVKWRPEHRELHTATRPTEYHDWVVFSR